MAKKVNAATRWAVADLEIRKVIGALLEVADLSKPELAVRLHISQTGFYNKLHRPADFRLSELRRLADMAEQYGVEVPLGLGGERRLFAVAEDRAGNK